MGFIMYILSWAAGWVAVLSLLLCLAAGLYMVSDIVEENSMRVRKWLYRAVLFVMGCYVAMMLDGSVPPSYAILGVVCHLAYFPLFDNYPFVEPLSLRFGLASIATITNHTSWFIFFLIMTGAEVVQRSVIGFFLVFIWAIPLTFIVSIQSTDDYLPATDAKYAMAAGGGKKKGVFKSFVDFLLDQKDMIMGTTSSNRKNY